MKLSMESSRSFSRAVMTLFLRVVCVELPEQVMLLCSILLYVLLATDVSVLGFFRRGFLIIWPYITPLPVFKVFIL